MKPTKERKFIIIEWSKSTREFRVPAADGNPDNDYYTADKASAVTTARSMYAEYELDIKLKTVE